MVEQSKGKFQSKNITSLDAWSMAFGCMVGWGAFVMPGSTFLPLAGPAGTLIAMLIGLVVTLVIGSCVSYLMIRSSGPGGIYSYAKEAFGRDHAFICSWFLCLSYLTVVFLNGTALFFVVRTLLGEAAQKGFYYTVAGNPVYLKEVFLSVCALGGIGMLFIVARPVLRRLTTILAMLLLFVLVATSVCCLPKALSGGILWSFGYQGINKGFAIFSLAVLAPWAFVGFEVTPFGTALFNFPIKRTKWVIASSIVVAALAYIAMALVSVSMIPDGYDSWQAYMKDLSNHSGIISVPTFYAAKAAMGNTGLVLMVMTTMAAILTGIIEAYRAMVNLLSTMAEDKILSGRFTKTSFSIFFIMILSILISFLGRNTRQWFVELTSFGAIVAYGYASAAAFKIAKEERNFKVMMLGLTGVLVSFVFGIVQIVPNLVVLDTMNSEAFLLLSLWCLLGFVFYWHTVKRGSLTEYSGMAKSGMVLFSLLVYASFMWFGKLLMQKSSLDEVQNSLLTDGVVLMVIVFVGLGVMLYIQNLVRRMHETAEREKIRDVEGSLARSQFLFNMSHDIRTPMNAIIGYTTLALKEPEGMLRSYLQKIDASSRQLLTLLNDILEMSRLENGRVELEYNPTDLCLSLEKAGEMFAKQMRQKRLNYSVHTSQVKDRYVWCDKKNLNRVFLNIISNAYKFTPRGGTVFVSINEVACDERDYGAYEFRVRDTGIGMSKEFVSKMFNAFERERTSTDSGMEGTGLGLAITKRIVDMMGGSIEVTTSRGSGTEVVIYLRFRLASEKDMQKESDVEKAQTEIVFDFTGKCLLLVEDNEINLEIAKMLLEQMGFDVDIATNGEIAVKKVVSSQPGQYDAILMDIQMPVMDGYAATREIRALNDPKLANIPIIAMTANAFPEDIAAAKEAGMQAHVAKPIDIGLLRKELIAVLKK